MDDTSRIHDFAQLQRNVDGPDWRWALARREAARATPSPLIDLDEFVRTAADYRRLTTHRDFGLQRAARQHPVIHAAVTLWEQELQRRQLQVLALGDCPPEQIAQQLGVAENVIGTATALFFDVGPILMRPVGSSAT